MDLGTEYWGEREIERGREIHVKRGGRSDKEREEEAGARKGGNRSYVVPVSSMILRILPPPEPMTVR